MTALIDLILYFLLGKPSLGSMSGTRDQRWMKWYTESLEAAVERNRQRQAAEAANAPPTPPS